MAIQQAYKDALHNVGVQVPDLSMVVLCNRGA